MPKKKVVINLFLALSIVGGILFLIQFSEQSVGSSPVTQKTALQKPVNKISMGKKSEHPKENKHYNRLIKEKSPYLLKHAENPVDWYPWGEEAFKKAKDEDKPIFLSIGYSTCHWCNVMERESFNDEEAAKLMNENFVSIKVDREERPDIDNIYMSVCQMMLRGGCGWPLNLIMTPDKKPFYAATYVPKNARFGRSGLMDLIPRVREVWDTRRDGILRTANQVMDVLEKISGDTQNEELDKSILKTAFNQFNMSFDEEHGGFGMAPKFPSPHTLLFLLRHWSRTGDDKSLLMVEKTLQEMSQGGVYDHIGFGFHRYSTDQQWLVPHFEKMLYDQAMLAMVYTEAYQATGKKIYEKTAREIFTYILRDMTSPEGLFYSAEDADSEDEEGKFYFWTKEELEKVLDKDEAKFVIKVFNIEKEGNFIDQMERRKTGANIFHLQGSIEEIASKMKIDKVKFELKIEKARKKLFEAREKRIHPYKDDKALTDWNGLMIAAFAKAAQAFDDPSYTQVAKRAADFILSKLRTPEGRLLHRYRLGEAAIPGMVDDYAYFTWGLLELYEASFEVAYLDNAIKLTDDFLKRFWDKKNGGFFFSSHDGEKMLVPWKDISDGALPSGNSVSMLNLLRLGRITAKAKYEEKASEIGRIVASQANRAPMAFAQVLIAYDFGLGPSFEIVISGKRGAKDTMEMVKAIRTRYIPNKVVILRSEDETPPDIVRIAEFTKNQVSMNGKSTAYVCLNYNCKLPTTDIEEMLGLLDTRRAT